MKACVGIILTAVLAFTVACMVQYPSRPFSGKLKTVTITKRFFEEGTTNAVEKSLVITNTQDLAQLRDASTPVWRNLTVANSFEGSPKYRMQVTYADGRSERFSFTRTEWGGSGHTPRRLLKYLEDNCL
jgi:hypothetical protein